MTQFYSRKDPIKYEGPSSANELAFRWYNPDQKVLGKTMREHLRFAVAYWHTLCWPGTDPARRAGSARAARSAPGAG